MVRSHEPLPPWPLTPSASRALLSPDAVPAEGEARTEPTLRLVWAPGPPGATAQVPERPAPAADAAIEVALEDHVSLAVALDILSTQWAVLRPGPQILGDVVESLLCLRQDRNTLDEGLRGDPARAVGDALRRVALGPVGEARAALAASLQGCSQALGEAETLAEGIKRACDHITQAAPRIIALALWALEAQETRSRHRR